MTTDFTPDQAEENLGSLIDEPVPNSGRGTVPVVGVGASEAARSHVQRLLHGVPQQSGLAFVVLRHDPPNVQPLEEPDRWPEALKQATGMRVVDVQQTVRLEPDTVYLVPPERGARALDGALLLTDKEPEHGRMVIDLFLRSMADTHGSHSAAVLLSAAGGDGAIGLKRVKERGGLTVAQDPDEAVQDALPRAAIATGMVDWVLPVEQISPRLLAYFQLEPQLQLPPEQGAQLQGTTRTVSDFDAPLRDVLTLLRTRTGRDFAHYKRATILRRIGRRMQVNGVNTLPQYLDCLRVRPGEPAALLQDLLITVTNFFRDASCFAALEGAVPQLFEGKGPHDTVRVWVPACATGEEAYSIAILLAEHCRTLDAPPLIQVFATDLDEDAVGSAREGIYPEAIEADVSEERLRRFFDVFGDQEVLDRYEEARQHQRQLAEEVEAAERELTHGQAQLAVLEARVDRYRQYQAQLRERELLDTEVIPVLAWAEERQDVAARLGELHRQRVHQAAEKRQRGDYQQRLLSLLREQQDTAERVRQLEAGKSAAQGAQQQARDAERPVEDLVKHADELRALASVEGDAAQLAERVQQLEARKSELAARWHEVSARRAAAQQALDGLQGQRQAPPPADVDRFLRVLRKENIGHHVVADVIEIVDERWRAAAEGVLRGARWVVVLQDARDEARAMALAERERYRHYLVADAAEAPARPDPASLLAVLRFSTPAPAWLLKQLAQIRRVDGTDHGVKQGGEWITPEAYWRDARGGRSVWVDPAEHQFGAAALASRRGSIERRLADLDQQLTKIAQEQGEVARQLKAAVEAGQGHRAAEELARRSEEFAQARLQLPALKQARVEASRRWQELDAEHKKAVVAQTQADAAYRETQNRLSDSERAAEKHEREWKERYEAQRARAVGSRALKGRFPVRWIEPTALADLRHRYTNATQARLRHEGIERDLAQGQWETDATVEEKVTLMRATVGGQQAELEQRKASNEAARIAVGNARERYIDVLRATVRRYRKNIVDLGQLAGVEVGADLPHLDNDDMVLRQAELKVSFNFDGKGQIGLNDGEASGGQQVIKSLILLVGLLKDDETPGGFVFIDEPFAHLDVRNIQLVGHFLKSTRAQYVLTTPITHNVEVFEPADITLVTAKKPAGARWAPPIGVLQRRSETAW